MTTQDVILAQLKEDTGRVLTDSGGFNGRAWQRNATKTWVDLTKESVTLRATAYYHNGKPELGLFGTVSLASWLEANLEYCPELQSAYDGFAAGKDEFGMNLMEQFVEAHGQAKPHEGEPVVINTCNESCDLSQGIQFIEFNYEMAGQDVEVLLLQVHGGCDQLYGYTAPKAYKLRGDSTGDWIVTGYACDSMQWDADGSNSNTNARANLLNDMECREFVHTSKLAQHLEDLAGTDKDTPDNRALMVQQDKRNEAQALEDFCLTLDECVVVFNREAYYVDGDEAKPEKIYAECHGLYR
jgi:hypothetical protein